MVLGLSPVAVTILRFVNRKFCNLILDKKHEQKKLTMQNYVFKTMWNYLLVRICLLLTRGLLGNVGSWGELVKFTVPSAQKVLRRFVVQWMSHLLLLNMTETWHHFIQILFLKKSDQSQAESMLLLSNRVNVSDLKFFRLYSSTAKCLNTLKVTCGRCYGFFRSKWFVVSLLFFPIQWFWVP